MLPVRDHHRYPLVLALVSALILLVGYRLKPKDVVQVPETELRRLQFTTQRRSLDDLQAFFRELASRVSPHLVWIEGANRSGIVWDERGLIVTARPEVRSERDCSVDGRPASAELFSRHYPVGAVRASLDGSRTPAFRSSAGMLEPGSWVLAVAARRAPQPVFMPATYSATVTVRCGQFTLSALQTNLPPAPALLGGGLFDLDGSLVGVWIECEGRYFAVEPGDVDRLLEQARSLEGLLLRWYGLRVHPSPGLGHAGEASPSGLLVSEVWSGRPAHQAGLWPGDVIQRLNEDPVRTLEDLWPLVLPIAYPEFNLQVSRNRQVLQLRLRASNQEALALAPAYRAALLGLAFPQEGFVIEKVVPGSPAYYAGLEAGDRVVRVNGRRPRNPAELEKLLAAGNQGTVSLIVQRGDRLFAVFLGQAGG